MSKRKVILLFLQIVSAIAIDPLETVPEASPRDIDSEVLRFRVNETVCESFDCVTDGEILCRVSGRAENTSEEAVSCSTDSKAGNFSLEDARVKCLPGEVGDTCRLHYKAVPRHRVRRQGESDSTTRISDGPSLNGFALGAGLVVVAIAALCSWCACQESCSRLFFVRSGGFAQHSMMSHHTHSIMQPPMISTMHTPIVSTIQTPIVSTVHHPIISHY